MYDLLLHECKGYLSNIGIEPEGHGPRASANIMMYSQRTHAITSLLHDDDGLNIITILAL